PRAAARCARRLSPSRFVFVFPAHAVTSQAARVLLGWMDMSKSFTERLSLGRTGDPAALAELFARWRPLLYLQARRLLGSEFSARVDPSDVVQDACTQAFQNLAQFRGQSEAEWV